jgi:cleavage and polyadenylation specificity factor subunit 1
VTGKANTVADTLSRLEQIDIEQNVSFEQIAKEQNNDSELQNLLGNKNSTSLKLIKSNFQGLQIIFDTSTGNLRPYIPKTLQKKYFLQVHNLSHPGNIATLKTLSQRGVWKNMREDCRNWTKTCIPCQKTKVNKHTRTPISTLTMPRQKFCNVHMDLIGPLPPSEGMRYCLTLIDRFTRWSEVIPLENIEAKTIVRALFDNWIARYGVPTSIVTDQGRQFTSHEFKTFCNFMGIIHNKTTSFHPQSNGLVERFHGTLKN